MAQGHPNWAALIFGGIFLGVWIYGILFGFPEWQGFKPAAWTLWGLLGIAIAGGLYAASIAVDTVRIVIIVAVGIFLGLLIMAAFLEEEAHIIGTFVAGAGAGLVSAALPRARHWEQVPSEEPQA